MHVSAAMSMRGAMESLQQPVAWVRPRLWYVHTFVVSQPKWLAGSKDARVLAVKDSRAHRKSLYPSLESCTC